MQFNVFRGIVNRNGPGSGTLRPTIGILLVLLSTGCCNGGPRHYSDDDVVSFQPAYCEWRYVCKQSSKCDLTGLPKKPAVGCAWKNLCDNAPLILSRIGSHPELYSRMGEIQDHDHPDIPGEDLASGQIEKSFSAYEFEYLCQDAVAGGYDIVVISYHSDFTVIQGGQSRLVSASCSGAIIAAKSRQVIAPILVQYGTSSRSMIANATAPAATAPSFEDMQAEFADQVAQKLEAILTARECATQSATTKPAG
jgi:hypothetical protein